MAVSLNLFTDTIDALSRAVQESAKLGGLTGKERDRYRSVVSETYLNLNTAMNIVLLRLNETYRIEDPAEFVMQVRQLDSFQEWYEVERSFYMCDSLRATYRELSGLGDRWIGRVAAKDWEAFFESVDGLLNHERGLAEYISFALGELSGLANDASPDRDGAGVVRQAVAFARDQLRDERSKLIRQEEEMYALI